MTSCHVFLGAWARARLIGNPKVVLRSMCFVWIVFHRPGYGSDNPISVIQLARSRDSLTVLGIWLVPLGRIQKRVALIHITNQNPNWMDSLQVTTSLKALPFNLTVAVALLSLPLTFPGREMSRKFAAQPWQSNQTLIQTPKAETRFGVVWGKRP